MNFGNESNKVESQNSLIWSILFTGLLFNEMTVNDVELTGLVEFT